MIFWIVYFVDYYDYDDDYVVDIIVININYHIIIINYVINHVNMMIFNIFDVII